MKKLKLKLDGIKEMLTKEQMKKVNGGYDGGSCYPPTDCDSLIWQCYDIDCFGAAAYVCAVAPGGLCTPY